MQNVFCFDKLKFLTVIAPENSPDCGVSITKMQLEGIARRSNIKIIFKLNKVYIKPFSVKKMIIKGIILLLWFYCVTSI